LQLRIKVSLQKTSTSTVSVVIAINIEPYLAATVETRPFKYETLVTETENSF